MSVIEIFCTLVAGGTVCIPSAEQRLNDLATAIKTMKINWAILTPTVLASLHPEDLPHLRFVLVAGEISDQSAVDQWAAAGVDIRHAYGLTEWTGIFAVSHKISGQGAGQTTIGKPVDAHAWLVNTQNPAQLVPLGAPGELVIKGPGLARGYLHDPIRTKASFLSDLPWLAEWKLAPGQVYRTGDIMRYHVDGSLVYLHRKDNQIKIRGLRVELGEIESHLTRILKAAKRVAVVACKPNGSHDLHVLIALILLPQSAGGQLLAIGRRSKGLPFVQLPAKTREELRDAREHLRRWLPDYMIPQFLLPLTDMPTTVSGKIDRRQIGTLLDELTVKELMHVAGVQVEHQLPVTANERVVHEMTCKTLGLDLVSMQDSFFGLAGDSVAAMKMSGLARQHGLQLTVKDIFEAPILQDLATRLTRIEEPTVTAISFALLRNVVPSQIVAEIADQAKVNPLEIRDAYPCSALQEGLCALSMRDTQSYKVRLICHLRPGTDLQVFRAAWERTYLINDILRTRFVTSSTHGTIQAVIQRPFRWDEAESFEQYVKLIEQDPMGLGKQLVRACLLRDSRSQHQQTAFVLTLHHGICDRWSIRQLLKQIDRQVQAFSKPLELDPIEFRPFIAYITETASKSAEYWANQFQDIRAVIFPELPAPDYTPVADQLTQYDIKLPTHLVREITIANYIRLAWALVLAHNTSSDDVVFGTIVSGRASPVRGIVTLTGPTIATVPIRINLGRELTVLHALTSIQRQSIEMLPWEQAGLQNIRRFSPEADRACSFQSLFTVQPFLGNPPPLFSACEEGAAVSGGFASYALNIECYVSEDERRMQAKVAFDPRVIALGRVQRLLEHLQVVLNEITAQPERRLSSISPLSPSDMSLLWEWNKSVPPKPKELLHEIIQGHAQKTPKSPAVSAFDGELTFEELEWHATQLAGELLQQVPRPGMLLPMLFEKSVWVTVTMLAVLKIGSAIVPLDASYSIERMRTICTEVEAPLVICSSQMASTVEQTGLRPVIVAHTRAFFSKSASPVSLPPVTVHSDSPCYMIFTSGSTGMPKGLLVNHGAFAASMLGWMPKLHVDKSSRVLQFSSFAFDACFAETFTALFAGACICVPSDNQRMNDLHAAMRQHRISHAILTPSSARVVRAEQVPSLRVLALVGEPILPSDMAYWAPRVRLLNGYGPAECAPASTVQYIDGSPALDVRDIGHPVGCVAWICDPRDSEILKPVGVAGELLIEGPNLGLGYFKDAAKTDSAFVQPRWLQSLRGMTGVRAYRSSDLVCYTEDGRLRYLGRIGNQVKLRGQRLDPSHIEHQLVRSFPGATEVAVVVACPRNASHRPTLAAFVVVNKKANADGSTDFRGVPTKDFANRAATARVRMEQVLPGYMMPTLMIPVSSLPCSAAGKLDRRALENEIASRTWKELSQYESVKESSTDRTPLDTERDLQGIWAKVLGLPMEAVGLRQSFFALGGDSITAMLVVAEARGGRVGVNMTVDDIFRFRTIEQIAAQAATRAATIQQLCSHDVVGVPFKLTPIQQLFFRTQGQQVRHRFNHNLLLHLTQRISYHRLESAMKTIVTAHPMLRARFVPGTAGLDWKQNIPSNIEGTFRCKHHTNGTMDRILADGQRSLSITAGPVFSADLIDTEERQSILLVAHHLVVDLVSWTVILNDLDELLRGDPISGHTSTSFQTWSRLLDEYVRGQVRAARLPDAQPWDGIEDFWGVSQEQMTFGSCEDTTVQIERETTDLLLGDVNKTFGTQPVEVLHAALLFAFIQAFPKRPPPTTYSEAHGREAWDATTDLTRTVGWFTTLAPILLQLDSASELSAVVGQVKDARRRLTRNGLDAFTNRQQAGVMEIVFNYGGRYTQQLQKAGALFEVQSFQTLNIFDTGADVRRWSVVDINSFVQDGKLTFVFTHPRGSSQTRIISGWTLHLMKTLKTLATDFSSASRIYTPMDFPLLKTDNAQLQRLLSSLSGISPASDIENMYPCAPIQRGILLSQEKERSHYHVTMLWEIQIAEGESASVPRAKDAIHQVITCHPCLRTSFVRSFSERALYDQVVMHNASPQIEVVHNPSKGWQGLPSAQGSPLTPEFPSRFTIHVDQEQRVYIRLDVTHALVDAMSFSVIQRDLCLAYEGRLDISSGPPYANFIAYLQSRNGEEDRVFWEEELEGIQPCLFPSLTDYQLGEVDDSLSWSVELQHSEEIYAYCRAHSVTPANIFCLAWSLVLRSYVGSDDVCFGVLASGRELPFYGAQDVVGPLINVLTFRNRLKDDLSVGECLQQVHTKYLRYMQHQTYPLADISHQKGDAFLFNTVLSIQRVMASADTPTSTYLNLVHRRDPVEYAIAINIDMGPSRIAVHLRYWLSSLSSEQAMLIASSFEQAVHQIITND
jgi:amino acid adenylation domain-containing protein